MVSNFLDAKLPNPSWLSGRNGLFSPADSIEIALFNPRARGCVCQFPQAACGFQPLKAVSRPPILFFAGAMMRPAERDREFIAGHHYWPDAAALTMPRVNIANVLAIGWTIEDARAEIIDENGWG